MFLSVFQFSVCYFVLFQFVSYILFGIISLIVLSIQLDCNSFAKA